MTYRLDTIEGAIEFATRAHDGQLDKAGIPYILHPLRVGARLYDLGDGYVIAGLLHDVVEDTLYTLADLKALSAPPEVVDAVESVTKTASERGWDAYRVALDRALQNEIGAWVKASDIADNYARLDGLNPDVRRGLQAKYEKAIPYMAEHGFDPNVFL